MNVVKAFLGTRYLTGNNYSNVTIAFKEKFMWKTKIFDY